MKLSTRLLLLILGCLLPIVAAQIFSLVQLHARRDAQIEEAALRQTVLVSRGLFEYFGSVIRLAELAAQLPDIRQATDVCPEQLQKFLNGVPSVDFLAVVEVSGRTLCASTPFPWFAAEHPHRVQELLRNASSGVVGGLLTSVDSRQSILPLVVAVPAADTGAAARFILVGIDPVNMAERLESSVLATMPLDATGTMLIVGRDAIVVSHTPPAENAIGMPIPDPLRELLSISAPTIRMLNVPGDRFQSGRILAIGVPISGPNLGLTVIQTLSLSDLTSGTEYTAMTEFMVIGISAVLALVLAWAAGRRFIYQPTEDLLRAARRWQEGDLEARAGVAEAVTEFAALARSFNAMAEGLQAREVERKVQAQFLEARVAERTHELSESNNRLQVEIAGRERTEAALHQAQKLQAVGQLAGGIAHDFNNMLATVLGNLELMERRVAQVAKHWTEGDTERLLKLIERASGAVQRGAQLTSRLLAFSRRQRLTAKATDLNVLIGDLVTLVSSTLGRRVRVSADLSPDLGYAMVDASQVEAAILNLCLNARDAMPEGGSIVISTANEVLIGCDHADDPPAGHYVRVTVSDTGVGMTPEVRRQAFDPFFTTKGPGGSGLGLSQVYGMARQSGGTVLIESALGRGTEVSILLPRALDAAIREANESVRRPAPVLRMGPTDLVLVVDDDQEVRKVLVEMLHDMGCEVVQAAGGAEALELVAALPRALRFVLLDYAMPEMNGLELASRLRDIGVRAPMALITGYAELAGADTEAIRLDGFLRKPFTMSQLQGLLIRLRTRADGRTALMPQE